MIRSERRLSRARAGLRDAGALIGPVPAIAAVIALAACGEPLHPSKWKDPPDEIPEGEGLFTGEDGEWDIHSDD